MWSLKDALEGFVSKESLQGYMCSKTKQQVGPVLGDYIVAEHVSFSHLVVANVI